MGGDRFTVLLVEDNDADAMLVREAFLSANPEAKVTTASTATQAYRMLTEWGGPGPSLVLLDLTLPDMSGHELLRQIRSTPKLHLLSIVILTGSSNADDRLLSHELGANAHVVKPMDLHAFSQTIVCVEAFWLKLVSPADPALDPT